MSTATLTIKRFTTRLESDERLMAAALERDPVAFSELYRRHKNRIYGYCLARLMSPEAAADATQEVFLRLLRSESETIEHPLAWLFTVARNVIVDMLRKGGRLREDADLDEDSPAWSRLVVADSAEEMLTREEARNIFLALRRVNPRYRTALILREIHAQSSRDIAEALGATVGAVDTLVSRARDAFGTAYAEVCGLPEECRANVTLIYKREGTGLDRVEQARLKAHLSECDRCRMEAKQARDPRRMPVLLPFLVPTGAGSIERILAQASLVADPQGALGRAAETAVSSGPPIAAKIAGVFLAASLAATPLAGKSALDAASARTSARDLQQIEQIARSARELRPLRVGVRRKTRMSSVRATGATGPAMMGSRMYDARMSSMSMEHVESMMDNPRGGGGRGGDGGTHESHHR